MSSSYDEVLTQNPFYTAIDPDIIARASTDNWIICIPRIGTINASDITPDEILDHILAPSCAPAHADPPYFTLSKRPVHVDNKLITVRDAPHHVRILFDETVYVDPQRRYTLWCIEHPLNQRACVAAESSWPCGHFAKYIRYLNTSEYNLLDDLREVIDEYVNIKPNYAATLSSTEEIVYNLYANCVQVALKNALVNARYSSDRQYAGDINCAIETYMQHCIYEKLFALIRSCTATSDAALNKIIRNVFSIQLRDLDIDARLADVIPIARRELCNINQFRTVAGKIECLQRVFDCFKNEGMRSECCVTSEQLLNVFVLLIVKSNIAHWTANFTFLTRFRFSQRNSTDESSFLLANLEAAIEFLKAGTLDVGLNSASESPIIERLFACIKADDLVAVKTIFESTIVDWRERNLCHPLCSCDKCEAYMRDFRAHSSLTCNEKGCTPLHCASFYGRPYIVEYFLTKGIRVDQLDYSQATPLHYAAARGNQHALLLLLHADASTHAQDHDGNTALHVAANGGHENCVKALLYYLEQKEGAVDVNGRNNGGNTPLHIASKWGYVNIVRLLLQYGAHVELTNKNRKTAFDVAHNVYVENLLSNADNLNEYEIVRSFCTILESSSAHAAVRDEQQHKKINLLLNAIIKGDVPLMCFYLGIPSPNCSARITDLVCHPLCACAKCVRSIEETARNVLTTTDVVNINACNSEGYTALHVAAKYGRAEMLRLLLDAGAHVEVRTKVFAYTPLHVAVQFQRVQIVRELVKCGACDVDGRDARGNAPLHYACANDDMRMVEILLANGASTTIRNGEGRTAMQEAEERGLGKVVHLLRGRRGEDVVVGETEDVK